MQKFTFRVNTSKKTYSGEFVAASIVEALAKINMLLNKGLVKEGDKVLKVNVVAA